MFAPLLPDTRLMFSIQVFSSFIEKTYLLRVDMNTEHRLLMKATKSIKLNRSEF
jgi:hypothetical protein